MRIIVATDAALSTSAPVSLLFVSDCFHRCGTSIPSLSGLPSPFVSPICFTRYPTHPKGWKKRPVTFTQHGTMEERLRREYQFRVDVVSTTRPEVLKEIIVEINCRSHLVSEVMDNCHSIVSKHNHALPVRVYDRHTY